MDLACKLPDSARLPSCHTSKQASYSDLTFGTCISLKKVMSGPFHSSLLPYQDKNCWPAHRHERQHDVDGKPVSWPLYKIMIHSSQSCGAQAPVECQRKMAVLGGKNFMSTCS